jgi:hypothetical protein
MTSLLSLRPEKSELKILILETEANLISASEGELKKINEPVFENSGRRRTDELCSNRPENALPA